MPPRRRTSKDTPAKLASRMKRRWRIVLIRKTGQVLGTVEADDAQAAETVAAVQFELDEFQRRRLLVRELAAKRPRLSALTNGTCQNHANHSMSGFAVSRP